LTDLSLRCRVDHQIGIRHERRDFSFVIVVFRSIIVVRVANPVCDGVASRNAYLRQSILIYLSNAITALTLGFPLSSVSSWTLTRITTLGFLARAFAHSRSIISAFSISVSSRFMDILHDKPRRCSGTDVRFIARPRTGDDTTAPSPSL
jgi:hypothetical protein